MRLAKEIKLKGSNSVFATWNLFRTLNKISTIHKFVGLEPKQQDPVLFTNPIFEVISMLLLQTLAIESRKRIISVKLWFDLTRRIKYNK